MADKKDFLKADFKTLFTKKSKNTTTNDDVTIELPVYVPSIPEVNLLPDVIKEEYVAKELTQKFKIAVISIIGVIIAVWILSFITNGVNQGKIDTIANETTQFNVQASKLTPFESYRTQIEAKRSLFADKMANDINYTELNNKFFAAAASNGFSVKAYSVAGTAVAADGSVAAGGACVNPDPFSSVSGIGCITFSISGNGDLNGFFNALNKADSGFVNVFVPKANIGTSDGTASVEGTVSFQDVFYTKRYATYSAPLDFSNPAPATTGK